VERFWSKVDKRPDECWNWEAARAKNGYGRFMLNGRNRLAHVIAYELARGPIPSGLYVLHRCDNPPCVRPDHLFLGTLSDNTQDCLAKGRWKANPRAGSRCHLAKLDEEKVKLILESADSTKAVVRRFGISRAVVNSIRRGESWKHVKVDGVDPSELRTFRERHSLTQEGLARLLRLRDPAGGGAMTVGRWERGERRTAPYLVRALRDIERELTSQS
jgi:DNA-binding transcriptional regulator YiaG